MKVELDWDDDWQFDQVLALEVNSPQAIPELGLAYLVKNQVDGPEDAAKLAPVETTDEIINYCFVNRKFDGTIAEGSWRNKALKGTEWASLFQFIQDRPEVTKLKLKVKRGDKEEVIELSPEADQTWPLVGRGVVYAQTRGWKRRPTCSKPWKWVFATPITA